MAKGAGSRGQSGGEGEGAGSESGREDDEDSEEMKNKKDGEERSNWTQIGVAFRNKDGSFNVQLDSVPVDGRFNLRPFPERKQS